MTALLLVSLVAAYVTSSCSDVGKSTVMEGVRNLTTRKDANKTKRLIDRIQEDFDNMPTLQKDLSECNETFKTEISLSDEQTKLLGRLKLPRWKINKYKENSIERVNTRAGIIDALFQGDMVLSKEQQKEVRADIGGNRPKRQAYNDKTYPGMRWPNGVFYSLDGSLDNATKVAFKQAAELWMNNTCIDFKEDVNEEAEDLLLVFKERGCWAEVGRQGGWQLLSLGDRSCETIGMVAHEIGHALGFWHTHARYDRNDFITVLRKNVKHNRRKNFARLSRETNNNYNLPYDYGSVMHYGARTFTKNTTDVAIVPKDVNYMETLGSKFISFYDLLMMNMYYNCTDACRDVETNCSNEGFAHPRNCSKCICPSGYGGQLCDERPPGCGEVLNASQTWQTLEEKLDSNETGPDGYLRCTYWIKAPIGKRIEIKVLQVPDSSSFEGCRQAGVEIKTHSDQRLTGYRFCSNTFVNTTLTSHSNLVPVITYSLNEVAEQTNEEFHYENVVEGIDVVDDDYSDEDDEEENIDESEYGEYELGDVVRLAYRYTN